MKKFNKMFCVHSNQPNIGVLNLNTSTSEEEEEEDDDATGTQMWRHSSLTPTSHKMQNRYNPQSSSFGSNSPLHTNGILPTYKL